MESEKLMRQLMFLKEIDQLKNVIRQSPLLDRGRKENSAEHSWHLAMYAWLLQDYASEKIDVSRAIRMLLLHDVVEIDAGDTPIHGVYSRALQKEHETKAAKHLFGLLPEQQCSELMALWREFEDAESSDAKFAKALDRFQPLLVNIFSGGGTWSENDVSYEQVLERYGPEIRAGAPSLWVTCETWIAEHFAGQQNSKHV